MAESEAAKPVERPASGLSRWTPSLPTNLMSVLNPFSSDDSDRASTDNAHPSSKRSSLLASFLPANPTSTASSSPAPAKEDDDSVMFAEPETTRSDSDEASREGSVADSGGRRKSKKSDKAKTSYSICHPPPTSTTRQRLHRRPRSLMQLHRLQTNARPKPAFEIVPSANFSPRLRKATATQFKTKHGTCLNDFVVLKAEKYSASEIDEEQEARDIVALICKGRKDDQALGKARICFPDGREWEAYPTPNCGYEFFTTDEHGLGITVRWVPKRNKDGSKARADSTDRKFNFSTISPNSRRHPVIASLSKTSLDICDTFRIPEPSAVTPLSTPLQSSSVLAEAMDEEGESTNMCQTDDRLREIITMTSIWVAFKEGWSPFYKCDDKGVLQRSPSLQSSPSPSKSATFAVSPITSPPGSPVPSSPTLIKRASIKSVGSVPRKSNLFGKANRSSTSSFPEGAIPDQPSSPNATNKPGRTRADSASTVLVHRAASNRVKNQQQASWRVEMLASDHEMREQPSKEDLARSQSDSNIPTSTSTATPETPKSVARPILPSPLHSGTTGSAREAQEATVATPTANRRRRSPQERRSTAGSETNTSASEGSKKAAEIPKKKKKSAWRRLLCGSGQDM